MAPRHPVLPPLGGRSSTLIPSILRRRGGGAGAFDPKNGRRSCALPRRCHSCGSSASFVAGHRVDDDDGRQGHPGGGGGCVGRRECDVPISAGGNAFVARTNNGARIRSLSSVRSFSITTTPSISTLCRFRCGPHVGLPTSTGGARAASHFSFHSSSSHASSSSSRDDDDDEEEKSALVVKSSSAGDDRRLDETTKQAEYDDDEEDFDAAAECLALRGDFLYGVTDGQFHDPPPPEEAETAAAASPSAAATGPFDDATRLPSLRPSQLVHLSASELDSMVCDLEEAPPHLVTADAVENVMRPLASACAALHSVEGAQLAERLLALCLERVEDVRVRLEEDLMQQRQQQQQQRRASSARGEDDDGAEGGGGRGEGEGRAVVPWPDAPHPTSELYGIVLNGWAKSIPSSSNPSAAMSYRDAKASAQRALQILELMHADRRSERAWIDSYNHADANERSDSSSSSSSIDSSSAATRNKLRLRSIKADAVHYASVLDALSRCCAVAVAAKKTGGSIAVMQEALHEAESLLETMEVKSGLLDEVGLSSSSASTMTKEGTAAEEEGRGTHGTAVAYDDDVPKPDRVCYNAVLHALSIAAKNDSYAIDRAKSILRKMERIADATHDYGRYEPDRRTFNYLIGVLARSSNPKAHGGQGSDWHAKEAEGVIMSMRRWAAERRRRRGDSADSSGGSGSAVNAADGGISSSNSEEHDVDEATTRVADSGDASGGYWDDATTEFLVGPNVKSYNGVLLAWSNATNNMPHGQRNAERAEQILFAMLGHRDEDDKPKEAEGEGNEALKSMTKHADDDPSSSSPKEDDGDDFLLAAIQDSIKPDVVSFNTVINAWAKSGIETAGERAEALLEYMHDTTTSTGSGHFHDDDEADHDESGVVRPNLITHNSVINAWSRSRQRPDAGERAEAVLDAMLERGIRPSAVSFGAAIHAWARSLSDDARSGERAEALLNRLEALHRETGDPSCKPSVECYGGAIAAWVRQSGSDGSAGDEAMKAEAALRRMEESGIRPTAHNYNAVLDGWARDRNVDGRNEKITRARSILHEMDRGGVGVDAVDDGDGMPSARRRRHQGGIRPETSSYNHVIRACASNIHGAEARREAFFTAVDMYNRLCRSNDCEPDAHTYYHMFKALDYLLPRRGREREEIASQLFRACRRDGMLSNLLLKLIQRSVHRDVLWDLLLAGSGYDGRTAAGWAPPDDVRSLPKEWSFRANIDSNKGRRNRRRHVQR